MKGRLLDVGKGVVRALGRVSYEVLTLKLGLLDCKPNVCEEAKEVLVEDGEGGDIIF